MGKTIEEKFYIIEEVVYDNGFEFHIMDILFLDYDLNNEFREHVKEVKEYIKSNSDFLVEYMINKLSISLILLEGDLYNSVKNNKTTLYIKENMYSIIKDISKLKRIDIVNHLKMIKDISEYKLSNKKEQEFYDRNKNKESYTEEESKELINIQKKILEETLKRIEDINSSLLEVYSNSECDGKKQHTLIQIEQNRIEINELKELYLILN